MNHHFSRLRAAFVVTAAFCSAATTGKAAADQFFIADGDVAGLIAAINAANAESNRPASIHLAKDGTYSLTEVHNEYCGPSGCFGPNGLPVITTEMTINANGATIERSSEPGTPDFRIMIVIGQSDGLSGQLTLNDATITGGQTPNGAGGIASSGILTVVNCIIANNTSGLNGGGIGNAFGGTLTVIDSTVADNSANGGGGGIMNFSHANSASVTGSTITGNFAGVHGGGIDSLRPMTIANSTIRDNSAGSNGAGIANSSTLEIIDCIIRGNATVARSGGGVWTESPEVEVGDSEFCENTPDHIDGTFIDLGGNVFDEECPPDPSEFFIDDGDVAGLIAAINAANAEPNRPASIHLAKDGTYSLTEVDNFGAFGPNGLPHITSTVTINANGATIERSSEPGTPEFRILRVAGPSDGFEGHLTINDATITGAQTSNGAAGIGNTGVLIVVNCTVVNNVSALNGGGIGNAFGGTLTVIDSTITGNWANATGGGIKNFSHGDSATVINSTISGNGTAGDGGGIDSESPITIINSTITGNSTSNEGGGIVNWFSTLLLTESTVSDNTAMFGDGGGLWSNTTDTEVGNTLFCENDPDHISGPFTDLGGNEFSDSCKACPADLTGNGNVGVPDLLELLAAWGPCDDPQNCPADLTGNGSVGVPDLLELLSQWGPCP